MSVQTIDNTFGALQIGVLIAVFLFGIVTLQAHIYSSQFPDDRRIFKALVVIVWLLELGHTVAVAYESYTATITFYGRPEAYTRYAGFGVATILGGTLTMIVQSFFAWRLWTVLYHPYKYIGLACGLLAIARCAVSIFAGVEGIRARSLYNYVERYRGMLAALLGTGAAIDIFIASSMLWFLVVRKKKSLEKVKRLLDRLVAYTIRTGLVTSVAAVSILIVFFASPHTMVWLAMYTFLAKLYSNSLLSALNARSGLREVVGATGDTSGSSGPGKPGTSRARGLFNHRNQTNAISIQMKTTTEMAVDGYNVPYSGAGEDENVPTVPSTKAFTLLPSPTSGDDERDDSDEKFYAHGPHAV
ncbi:hypothetical protein D9611_012857 [Ephemerocybe angulata]|uniref:DUF6534 domain-containing protein n=1 Tax=Ephemerocybe angulata TaxID=980116 RepID=A0A8H5BCB3_9AGAR|nr:hypothetical protein D9611_012857 [Tulosesus angulatus]